MATLKVATLAITIALMGMIFIGALSVENEQRESTTYEKITDLTPLVQYDNVDGTMLYNPVKNVTGWSNATWQTQSEATIYVVHNEPATYQTHTGGTINAIGSRSAWISNPPLDYNATSTSGKYNTSDGSTLYIESSTDPRTLSNPYAVLGGQKVNIHDTFPTIGPFAGRDTVCSVIIDGIVQNEAVYARNLNDIASYYHWTANTIVKASDINLKSYSKQTWEFRSDSSLEFGYNINVTTIGFVSGDALEYSEFIWNPTTSSFNGIIGYNQFNEPITSSKGVTLYWQTSDLTTQLKYYTFTTGPAQYTNYYKFVNIDTDTTATWSNGEIDSVIELVTTPSAKITLDNGKIITASDEANQYSYIMFTLDKGKDEYYWQGITGEINLSALTIIDYKYPAVITTAEYDPGIQTSMGIQDSIIVTNPTYSAIEGSYFHASVPTTIQGEINLYSLIAINVTPSTADITGDISTGSISGIVSAATITLIYDDGEFGPSDAVLTINPNQSLLYTKFSLTNTTQAMVRNTVVVTDPLGQLWANPSLNIETKFPTVFENGARITFSSFVTTGDSITINGQTFTVLDGKIHITVGGMSNTYNLKGMAVEFRSDDHTYLVFTENANKTVDLGETISTKIATSGNWYFSSALNSINTTTTTYHGFQIGQMAELNSNFMIFTFLGIMILSALGISYYVRGGVSALDWLVIGLAGLVGLVLVI